MTDAEREKINVQHLTEEDCFAELATKAKMFGFRCAVSKRKKAEGYWVFSVMGDRPNWRRERFSGYSWTDSMGTGLIFIIVPTPHEAAKVVDEMCSMANA